MEFFDTGNIFLWRAAERLIALFIGAISIYLGYRLFASMREFKADGEGKVELPGGISIYVSRVGPGVFFALFGTAIVAFSLLSPAETKTTSNPTSSLALKETSTSYLGDKGNAEVFDAERGRTLRDLDALTQLEAALVSAAESGDMALSDAAANRLRIALPHIRQMLMASVWDEKNWGDLEDFRHWIHNGDPTTPPPSLSEAGRQYLNMDH